MAQLFFGPSKHGQNDCEQGHFFFVKFCSKKVDSKIKEPFLKNSKVWVVLFKSLEPLKKTKNFPVFRENFDFRGVKHPFVKKGF